MTLLAFVLTLVTAGAGQHVHPQPPAAGDAAATSALSAEAVQQLLAGDGMGLARPAEVHGYPGPKHLLERASELALSAEQQKRLAAIRQEVLDTARPLGKAIVQAERDLDAAFKSGGLTEGDVKTRLEAIAALQAELRLVHLRAHLLAKPLLTAVQLEQYYQPR